MHRFAVALSFIFFLSLATFTQQPCKEYGPVGAVLSLCPPRGSETIKVEEGGAHSAFYKKTDPQNPYVLTIVETQVTASLAEFGYEIISGIYSDAEFSNAVLLEIGDVLSANGVRGLRLVFAGQAAKKGKTKKDEAVRVYYLYDTPDGTKLTFAAFFLATDTKAEPLTDAAMKTVKIKK